MIMMILMIVVMNININIHIKRIRSHASGTDHGVALAAAGLQSEAHDEQ